MYFYLWNQWQILPEKSLIRKYRLSFAFFTIQHLWLFIKSILGDYFSLLPYPLLFTHHYPETCKPKFHCRRQSGMNLGYVTVNGVNSNNPTSVNYNNSTKKTDFSFFKNLSFLQIFLHYSLFSRSARANYL